MTNKKCLVEVVVYVNILEQDHWTQKIHHLTLNCWCMTGLTPVMIYHYYLKGKMKHVAYNMYNIDSCIFVNEMMYGRTCPMLFVKKNTA